MSNPKILDHLDHPSFLEIATYGDHDGGDTDSITVECTKCGEVVRTLWERGAENDESPRDQVERELHKAGVIEDPDMDGGLLG